MFFAKYRGLSYLLLCCTIAVGLAGCLLKPGSNDSSAAPASLLTADTSSQYATLFSKPAAYNGNASAAAVMFSHFTHVQSAQQACSTCHNDPFPMTGGTASGATIVPAQSGKLSMSAMYQGQYCGKCHNGAAAFDLKNNCNKCHGNLSASAPEVLYELVSGNVPFSHASHVGAYKKNCSDCHNGDTPWPMRKQAGLHTMAQMKDQALSCGKCHGTGRGAFSTNDCARCHTFSHATLNNTTPDSTLCKSCHADVYTEFTNPAEPASHGSATRVFTSASCAECHNHEAMPPGAGKNTTTFTAMQCQTCHNGKGLHKTPSEQLCATCHHMRSTYTGTNAFADGKPVFAAGTKSSYIIDWNGLCFNGSVASITAAATQASISAALDWWVNTAKYVAKSGSLFRAGNNAYPHYSSQYDILIGKSAGTFAMFNKTKSDTRPTPTPPTVPMPDPA